ncbi:5'/3'-nucleotidase SurE [Pseudomonas citronellolis]|uniref:5'/3'-nucleotidase SurE n=1 Tax=Pseudomonas citronellolis TaxID=53408 RepID=UPI0023E3D25B|nr:5'/3'-nucleotidase SurE [Pseudomonas citronellolis]MDF3936972.1 5'/3'-nucleotidase SurE [Pseudomonas citronellolis]
MHAFLRAAIGAAGIILTADASALNILLSNDDGCRAPGIAAVYQALSAAGHTVTLVAPDTDNSGIGAASVVAPGQALAVTQLAEHQYCVGSPAGYATPAGKNMAIGTPVDAMNVGLDLLLKDNPPDLVVSGSNFGDNTGPLIQLSGTLNAALWAMRRGVPALAVSTAIDLPLMQREPKAAVQRTLAAQADSARLAVRVLDRALAAGRAARQGCAGGQDQAACGLNLLGLPNGQGLNLNYPARPAAEVRGLVYAPVGDWSPIVFAVQRGADGNARVNLAAPPEPSARQRQADAYLLTQGYAVLSVVGSDLDGDADGERRARALVDGMQR